MPADRTAPHSRKVSLRTIRIEEVGRPFFFVWLANITILYICLYITGGIFAEILLFMAGASDSSLIEWVALLIISASVGFAGWNAWKNIDVLTAVMRPLTVTSLLVFAVVYLGLASLVLISQVEGAEVASALSAGWYGLIAAVAAISIIWLRSRQIKDLGLRLTDFIRLMNPPRLRSQIKALPYQNAPLGWFLLVGGVVALVGANITSRFLWDLVSEKPGRMGVMRVVEQMTNLSCFLLLYARTKFQPMAEMVLKSDQRPPVLFLRSFMDDERKMYMQASK